MTTAVPAFASPVRPAFCALPAPAAAAPGRARRPQAPAGGPRIVAALVRTTLLGFVREPVSFIMQFLYPLFMLFILCLNSKICLSKCNNFFSRIFVLHN